MTILLSGCSENNEMVADQGPVSYEKITWDTELIPAEEGPVRSALGQPTINPDSFRLVIAGLVDSSFPLSWWDIQHRPAVQTDTINMYCVEGWQEWGVWKGISIAELLIEAGIQSGGEYVYIRSVEGYKTALPISYINTYLILLAYQVNDSLLQPHDGFPLRLIAYGYFGYKWVKWVNRLEVRSLRQFNEWEIKQFLDDAEVPMDRRRYFEEPDAQPLQY